MHRRTGIREWFDNAEAVFFALLVHVAIAAMLMVGIQWQFEQQATPGAVIQAQVVDVSELMASMERDRQQQAAEEQAREQAAEQVAEQARREQAEREAEARAAQQRRQESAEQQRQQAAEAARLEAEREQQRREQLEALRREREQAAAATAAAEERLEQLEAERAAEQAERERQAEIQRQQAQAAAEAAAAREQQLTSQTGAWIGAVQAVVTQSWIRPPTARAGLVCQVQVYAIPGGEVVNASVITPCNADAATQRSIINAVMSASPLPYRGYEDVFQRSFNFEFRYDG